MNNRIKRLRAKALRNRQPLIDTTKRLPLTGNELPVQEWSASHNEPGFFSTSPDDAFNRGQRADQAMMKRLERTCWHCSKTYNPPLFSSEGQLFCSTRCDRAHAFTPDEQSKLREQENKLWSTMCGEGAFEGSRRDSFNSRW